MPGSYSIWNVPHSRNPNFTGRKEVLEGLRSALTSSSHAAPVQALSGLGGIGKTQLAIEYAHSHRANYDLVWWMRAEEPTTLAAEYAELAARLDLPQSRLADQRIQIEAVKRWLEHNSGWLLVFDNACEVGEIRQYLPQVATGHTLITSRNPNWRGVAGTLLVEVMNEGDADEFLRKRTGRTGERAEELAETLGYLPLALEQAGAYIEETGTSFGDYLGLFHAHQRELLSRPSTTTDYPLTVATTWELSFQQVLIKSPAGAELLYLCSFLAPDEIPFSILTPLVTLPSDGQSPLNHLARAMSGRLTFNDAVAALRKFSLVNTHNEALSFHRLVQTVSRNRLAEEDRRKMAEVALHLVNCHFSDDVDPDDIRTWRVPSQLLPHALAVTDHAEVEKVKIGLALRLLNQVGYHLEQLADPIRARAVLEKARWIGESNNADMTNTGIETNLGGVLLELGDFEGAIAIHESLLAADEKIHGVSHPNVARELNNLSGVLIRLGRYEEARSGLVRALAIVREAAGDHRRDTARYTYNLAELYREMGKYNEARTLFEQALAIQEQLFDAQHPSIGSTVQHLGLTCRNVGDFDGAFRHLSRALVIIEGAYGPDHPKVAAVLRHLGLAYNTYAQASKNFEFYKEALKVQQRALDIDKTAYGPDHLAVAEDSHGLGCTVAFLKDMDSARSYIERAINISERIHGGPNQLAAIYSMDIGEVLRMAGNLKEAKRRLDYALPILVSTYGYKHFKVASCLNIIGVVLRDGGNKRRAMFRFKEALEICRYTVGMNHPLVQQIRENIASLRRH